MALTKVKKAPKPSEPKMYFVQKVIKGDTYTVLADSALEQEDSFVGMYYTMEDSSKVFLEPPFNPRKLQRLISLNNTLGQCVDAMEVNIDGTGYTLVPADQNQKADPTEEKVLNSFFSEPYPGKSFITIRRALRRDLESVGWAFLEFLRTADGRLVGLRNVLTNATRMVKLDKPVLVSKTVERNGKDVTITYWDRERRLAQKLVNTVTYFREYGTTRQLDKVTGEWESAANPVPMERRASELMMFSVNPDPDSMYALPRWINNLPSVVGSRKAEEFNLEFFDAGGVPPAIIFVQGGTLAKDMSDQLRMYLSGQMKSKVRAAVVEAVSTTGSLDGAAGTVQVKVERFGSEKMNDPMYSAYDDASYERVRTSFRLPPLFLGKSDDYNFATAKTAYMVAESQVFQPERAEFDEIINKTVLKEFGVKTVRFKSNPITMKDVEQQLQALELAEQFVKKEEFVEEVSKVAGVNLQYDPEQAKISQNLAAVVNQPQGQPAGKAGNKPVSQPSAPSVAKPKVSTTAKNEAEKAHDLIRMAHDYGVAKGLLITKFEMSPSDKDLAIHAVRELDADDRETVFELVSTLTMNEVDPELMKLSEHECSS